MTNLELVEQLLACVGKNDADCAVELCSPEIEFLDVLAPLEGTVREVHGHDGLREWFAGLHGRGVRRVSAEPLELQQMGADCVLGSVRVTQDRPGQRFATVIYLVWTISDGAVARIESFFDRGLALNASARTGSAPARRWVEGVVTAKVIGRRTVRLRSDGQAGREFSVRHASLWHEIEVGAEGIAETDSGELVGWRPLARPQR